MKCLEDHYRVRSGLTDDFAPQRDLALHRLDVPAYRLEQGRLSASRGAEDHEPVRTEHLKAYSISGGDQVTLGFGLQRHAADGAQLLWEGSANSPACCGRSGTTAPSSPKASG